MQHDYKAFPNQRNARQILAQFPDQSEIIEHRGYDLLVPRFSTAGAIRLMPNADAPRVSVPAAAESPVMHDIGTPWDIRKHNEARRPVTLGTLTRQEQRMFVAPVLPYASHVLDMPIKFPGQDEARVVGELSSFVPTIQHLLDVDFQLNPLYRECYAYLSIHQGWVTPGERQRETPYHVDGFQGPRWKEKHPANHSYLVTDTLPTLFYPVAFPLDHIDPNFDDVYAEFERRVAAGVACWSAQDFEIVLMDCYCVHRGMLASTANPVFRTWLRISFETRIFDRLGNAHNPLFDYAWPMVARDTDPRIRPRALVAA